MGKFYRFCFVLVNCLWVFSINAQVSINNSIMSAVNVSEMEMCRVSLFNAGSPINVVILADVKNADNETVIEVETQPFQVNSGVFNVDPYNLVFQSIEYGSNAQGQYVNANQKLPFGEFQYCIDVIVQMDGIEGDQQCEEIISENNGFLFLVNPEDEEIIFTPNPMLIWMHSEPFDVLTSQDEFRILVVELGDSEDAQSGITTNAPLFYLNDITTHTVQYPFDAPNLLPGKRYGWQVQRICNNVIIERTDAWAFKLSDTPVIPEVRYAVVTRELSSGFHSAFNDMLYFKFDEKYSRDGAVDCRIQSTNSAEEGVQLINVDQSGLSVINTGHNQFEIDLSTLNLTAGYYVLEVKNTKGEAFFLKFLIE